MIGLALLESFFLFFFFFSLSLLFLFPLFLLDATISRWDDVQLGFLLDLQFSQPLMS